MTAWRVKALVESQGGWREQLSKRSSYSDAIKLGSKLEANGARKVQLVEELEAERPRNRTQPRAPATSRDQLELFNAKNRRRS